jgi:hypothetical protein
MGAEYLLMMSAAAAVYCVQEREQSAHPLPQDPLLSKHTRACVLAAYTAGKDRGSKCWSGGGRDGQQS